MSTTVKEFLQKVKEGLEAERIREADRVVRVVAGALKVSLPDEEQAALGRLLPADMSAAWEGVEPLPREYFERESMYREEGPPETMPKGCD